MCYNKREQTFVIVKNICLLFGGGCMERTYLCCDLKSYYASVECIDRGLDPMAINLVVADAARTDKTICLAVSPALKSFGISGRPRLFEVKQRVRDINYERRFGISPVICGSCRTIQPWSWIISLFHPE